MRESAIWRSCGKPGRKTRRAFCMARFAPAVAVGCAKSPREAVQAGAASGAILRTRSVFQCQSLHTGDWPHRSFHRHMCEERFATARGGDVGEIKAVLASDRP